MTPLWQLFVSGAVGSLLTFAVTWWRERRRTLDSYRAPQRAAIGGICAATHELMVCELEHRNLVTDLLKLRQDVKSAPKEQHLMLVEVSKALGQSTLAVERAFQTGTLTVVDADCWQAMGIAYGEFDHLRTLMVNRPATETAEEIEDYSAAIKARAYSFNKSVGDIVKTAANRLSPVEGWVNRRRRNKARQTIADRYEQSAIRPANAPPT